MKRLAWAVWLAVWLVGSAEALDPSWRSRLESSSLAVVGRCESRTSHWEGGAIYSLSDVSVERLLAGSPPGTTVVVRQPGGVVGDIGQKVSHVSLLEPGTSYVLFLSPDSSGELTPIADGAVPIVSAPDGSREADDVPLDELFRELGGER